MIITDRYFSAQQCTDKCTEWADGSELSIIGYSFENRPIHSLEWGNGTQRILIWSQMHGNETTTTRALELLLRFLNSSEAAYLASQLRLCIVPQLNPDGATYYTRENAQKIDLNRDAQQLNAPESRVLRNVFETFAPHWCFNLHGQRTIYAAGEQGPPATLSFLAPAADKEKLITPTRKKAMAVIATIHQGLNDSLSGGVGRYEDTFNPDCVGDYFTTQNIPTLLFEAGHYPDDYARNITRDYVFNALKIALETIVSPNDIVNYKDYLSIPENTKSYVDLLFHHASITTKAGKLDNQLLALHFEEQRMNNAIEFVPRYHSHGKGLAIIGHRNIQLEESIAKRFPFDLNNSLQIAKNSEKLLANFNF